MRNILVILFFLFLVGPVIGHSTVAKESLHQHASVSETDEPEFRSLRILHVERGKEREFTVGTRVTAFTTNGEYRGRLAGVRADSVFVDVMRKGEYQRTVGFRALDLRTVSVRSTGSVIAGVALSITGVGLIGLGLVNVLNDSSPTAGGAVIVAGGAAVGMSPGLFKNGRKFHLDGEWRLLRT